MRTIVIIPARYKSSRFPGKPLIKLLGKPMILWVAEVCEKAVGSENVYVATDDQRIASIVRENGFQAIMTSEKCLTGTDRLAEVAQKIEADVYVNVQGDEPLVDPKDIRKIIEAKIKYPNDIAMGYTAISNYEDPKNINIPKVIFTENRRLVYISRQLIPGHKEATNAPIQYYKQVCIYAFSRSELLYFGQFGRKSELESYEDIEILRFFEGGKTIRLIETKAGSLAVDEPSDVSKLEAELKKQRNA